MLQLISSATVPTQALTITSFCSTLVCLYSAITNCLNSARSVAVIRLALKRAAAPARDTAACGSTIPPLNCEVESVLTRARMCVLNTDSLMLSSIKAIARLNVEAARPRTFTSRHSKRESLERNGTHFSVRTVWEILLPALARTTIKACKVERRTDASTPSAAAEELKSETKGSTRAERDISFLSARIALVRTLFVSLANDLTKVV
mmetsp:Transcript_13210/g.23483  ORF Transcript_13210/g.23483 Transcript_13210/m.23483 type:complete len:206 (+) Transcript_13210:392-1009(+)